MIAESMIKNNGHSKPTSTRVAYTLADYRHNCGRLLFRGLLVTGSRVTIRCPKCGGMASFGVDIVEADNSDYDSIDITEVKP